MKTDDLVPVISDAYESEVRNRNQVIRAGKTHEQMMRIVSMWLTDKKMKPGMLLFGGIGNGKTTTARAILEAIASIRNAAIDARDAYIRGLGYVSMVPKTNYDWAVKMCEPKMITARKLAELAMSEDRSKFNMYKDHPFLIIDDLGCEPSSVKVYGNESTPVVDVIYHRYDVLLPTVFTTNLDMNGINMFYGERVGDRLKEFCEMIAFTGKSLRN